MNQLYFSEEQNMLREQIRRFVEQEIADARPQYRVLRLEILLSLHAFSPGPCKYLTD